jgi:hypothetical protein
MYTQEEYDQVCAECRYEIYLKDKEIERLNNIIYTTLEYVDREEINSTGKPYIY